MHVFMLDADSLCYCIM